MPSTEGTMITWNDRILLLCVYILQLNFQIKNFGSNMYNFILLLLLLLLFVIIFFLIRNRLLTLILTSMSVFYGDK